MSAAPPAAAVRTARARLVGLDGLRGFLALCVILVHVSGYYTPTVLWDAHFEVLGQAIVVFFALSGFLIYLPFARALLDRRAPLATLRSYVRARVLRVFPAYLVIFTIANLAGLVYVENAMTVLDHGRAGGTGTITDPLTLLLHYTLLQNYVPSMLLTGINSSWTLTVEIAFYLFLPFLAALTAVAAARLAPRASRYLIAVVPGLVLILVGVTTRVVLAVVSAGSGLSAEASEWGANPLAVLSRSILPWCDAFGWGMVAIVAFLAAQRGDIAPPRVRRLRTILWPVGFVLLAVSGILFIVAPRLTPAAFGGVSAAVILLLVLPTDGTAKVWRVSRAVDNPVLFWIGTVSLSTYLWHYPVILLVHRLGWYGPDTWPGWAWNFALVTAISIALASISYQLVEKPAMRLKFARKDRS